MMVLFWYTTPVVTWEVTAPTIRNDPDGWFRDTWGQYASKMAVRSRRTYEIMTPAEDVIWKPAPHQMIQATRLLL